MMTNFYKDPVILQRYISSDGDKRISVLDQDILGVLLRVSSQQTIVIM